MRNWLIATQRPNIGKVEPRRSTYGVQHMDKQSAQSMIAAIVSFGIAALTTSVIVLAWLPAADAARDETASSPTNTQTAQLLAFAGGPNNLHESVLPSMMVVSNNAIQADMGISGLNDSGFLPDAPEINVLPEQDAGSVRRETFTHIVSPGENLSGIASRYGLKLSTVLWANGLQSNSTLRAGAELEILPVDGVKHTVQSGETLSGIASKYKAKSQEIAEFNAIDPARLSVGVELFIPGGTGAVAAPRVTQKSNLAVATTRVTAGQVVDGILIPVTGIVTQGYGPTDFAAESKMYKGDWHRGVDIANTTGTPIVAAHDGTVILAGTLSGYGKVVYLKGTDLKGRTTFTRYGHLNSISVTKHQVVKAGEQLGTLGSTGRSTGPHLHFEVRDASDNQFESGDFYQMYWGY